MGQTRFRAFAITAAVAAALAISACGTTTTTPSTTAPGTTPAGTTPASPPASPAPTGTAGATESIKGIPFYKPSTVRTHTGDSATLTSPDPVTKVSDYYVKAVDTGGWTTVSKSTSAFHGHLTVKKSGQGATISVAPSGSGSLISISAYPTG